MIFESQAPTARAAASAAIKARLREAVVVAPRVRRWRAFVSRRIMLCLPENGSKGSRIRA
jgi:hypothetical protein